MKCPFLHGKYLQSCVASREVYIPSEFEFQEYCTHSRHKICPLYSRSVYAGMPTSGVVLINVLSKTR
jgi:hypothetical protein